MPHHTARLKSIVEASFLDDFRRRAFAAASVKFAAAKNQWLPPMQGTGGFAIIACRHNELIKNQLGKFMFAGLGILNALFPMTNPRVSGYGYDLQAT